jgi:hypothetical protein
MKKDLTRVLIRGIIPAFCWRDWGRNENQDCNSLSRDVNPWLHSMMQERCTLDLVSLSVLHSPVDSNILSVHYKLQIDFNFALQRSTWHSAYWSTSTCHSYHHIKHSYFTRSCHSTWWATLTMGTVITSSILKPYSASLAWIYYESSVSQLRCFVTGFVAEM